MASVSVTNSPAIPDPKKDAPVKPVVPPPVAGAPAAPVAPAPAPGAPAANAPVQVAPPPAPASASAPEAETSFDENKVLPLPPVDPNTVIGSSPVTPTAPKVNNPLVAPLPPTIAPIQVNMGGNNASKELIDRQRNETQIAIRKAELAARQPRHLDISGRPITSTQGPFRDDIIFDSHTEERRKANESAHNMGKPRSTESREEFLARPLKSDEERQTAANIVAQDKFNAAQAQQAFTDAQGMGATGAQEKPNPAARAALAQSVVDPNRPTLSPFQALTSATGSKENAQTRIDNASGYRAQWAKEHPGDPSIFSQDDSVNFNKPVPIYRNSLSDPKADAEFGNGAMKTGKKFENMTPEEQYWTTIHEINGHATDRKDFNKTGDFVTGKPNAQYMRQATEVVARLRQLPDLNGGGKHPSSPAAALDLLSDYGFVEPGSGQKARYQLSEANGDIKDMLTDYLSMSPKEQKAWRKRASEIMPGTAQNKPYKPTGAIGGDTQVA